MINLEQAERSASEYLAGIESQLGMPLQVLRRLDVSFGWVFFYNTEAYVRSGAIGSMLAGNAPFVIDAEDGSLHVLGTAHPVERYLQEYERTRSKPAR
ncbi:YrhB domain-containing protein [Paraburkholderia aspalathi]|uniref:YrhB domain-containing protein n=1 Tax=Paraburkholderia aspalathi TaxID=1324617 RepID=UPI0038BB185A